MIKILFIFFSLLLALNARENPFFPSEGEKDITVSSNEIRDKEPLKRASISLPSHARLLQKVTLEYKSLDGSIESKSIELNNAIDWHLPIFISQSVETQLAQKTSQHKNEIFQQIASTPNLKFLALKRTLRILTEDEIIRDFMLVEPHRMVIDFKKEQSVKRFSLKNPNAVFKEIRIGNHKGFYRAVIELDGSYRYKKTKIANGYEFELL